MIGHICKNGDEYFAYVYDIGFQYPLVATRECGDEFTARRQLKMIYPDVKVMTSERFIEQVNTAMMRTMKVS